MPVDTDLDAVRKRYREIYNDLQLRITHAPTAHLKKTYRDNIEEARSAMAVLCPSVDPNELPAALPTADAATLNEPTKRQRSHVSGKAAIPSTVYVEQQAKKSWSNAVAMVVLALAIGIPATISALRSPSKDPGPAPPLIATIPPAALTTARSRD